LNGTTKNELQVGLATVVGKAPNTCVESAVVAVETEAKGDELSTTD
jgi:hypothetical protein